VRTPSPRDPARRAVVTGLGAVTPIGNDVATFWTNLVAGVSGVASITQFDASAEEIRIAAEVKGFDPRDWIDFKQARRMSRFSQLAVAAARQAIDGAGLKIGDVIYGINQSKAGSLEEFNKLLSQQDSGALGFLVRRGGSDFYVAVDLARATVPRELPKSPPARDTLLRT